MFFIFFSNKLFCLRPLLWQCIHIVIALVPPYRGKVTITTRTATVRQTQPITKQIRLFFKPKTIEFSHNLCEKFVTSDTNFWYFPATSKTESHLFRFPEMCGVNVFDAFDINRYSYIHSTNHFKNTFEYKSLIHLNCIQTKEVVNWNRIPSSNH